MKIAKKKRKFIFCLEGDWSIDLRESMSVIDLLRFLEASVGIKYIYRTIGTKEELLFRLAEYQKKRYQDFSILYLNFHGEENMISFGNEFITLDALAEHLEDALKNVMVHFGSCSTLKINKYKINSFIKRTNALSVSGYRTDVELVTSAAFEVLFFDLCQSYNDVSVIGRQITQKYSGLCKELEFFMVNL